MAHDELSHLDLHCLPSSFEFSILFSLDETYFEILQISILSSAFWYLKKPAQNKPKDFHVFMLQAYNV